MAVDGAELEEGIDPVEGHEIHPQGFENLLERDLQLPEETGFHVSRHGEHTDIEIRAFGGHRLPPQEAQAVIGAGPEKVDRQELKLAADLVQFVQWCLQFESTSNSSDELRWDFVPTTVCATVSRGLALDSLDVRQLAVERWRQAPRFGLGRG